MDTILNLVISFFTGVGICCTVLFILGKFKKPKYTNLKIDFSKHELPDWIKYDKQLLSKPIELPTDLLDVYFLGDKLISNIQRKDLHKIEGIYDKDKLKIISKK